MTEMDLLQFYNHLSLLTFAGSLLAILGLRIVTGSTSQQVELIQEFRTYLEQTSRNCMRARSAALAREFEAHDDGAFGRSANIVPLVSKRLIGRHYVEESDRLIRALASISRDSDGMRVSHLRRRHKDLKRVEKESVRLLSALEIGRR
jgi:hypothetical protein